MRAWVERPTARPTRRPRRSAVTDHGLTVGDGVFEAVKVVDGQPFALTRHLRPAGAGRPRASGCPAVDDATRPRGRRRPCWTAEHAAAGPDPDHLHRRAVAARLRPRRRPADAGRGRRADATRGPTTDGGRHGAVAPQRARARWPASRPRRTPRTCVALAARRASAGASEAIFANLPGHLCEGTGTNVFYVVDGELRTPTLAAGCLAGITRHLVLEWYGGARGRRADRGARRRRARSSWPRRPATSRPSPAGTTATCRPPARSRPRSRRCGRSASRTCSDADPPRMWSAADRALKSRSAVRERLARLAGAIGAVVARFVHTEEVTGSNPVSPTPERQPPTCKRRVGGLSHRVACPIRVQKSAIERD